MRWTIAALMVWAMAMTGWYVLAGDCSTDAECAATPRCLLTPGCDGGPDPRHQPWRWLP
jgi:hypothetical protein